MKARLVQTPPVDNTVAFKDMVAGDFLISQTGNVGVKTAEGAILWVVGAAGEVTRKQDISKGKRYLQPTSVVVTL